MTHPFMLGDVRVDPASNEIVVAGRRKRVRRKLMEALVYLAAQNGRVVERNELLEHVWRERPASDESLTQLMSELRRTLGEGGTALHTISGKGYRLAPSVSAAPNATTSVALDSDVEAVRETDRRWGFALLLGMFAIAQTLGLILGAGHHQ